MDKKHILSYIKLPAIGTPAAPTTVADEAPALPAAESSSSAQFLQPHVPHNLKNLSRKKRPIANVAVPATLQPSTVAIDESEKSAIPKKPAFANTNKIAGKALPSIANKKVKEKIPLFLENLSEEERDAAAEIDLLQARSLIAEALTEAHEIGGAIQKAIKLCENVVQNSVTNTQIQAHALYLLGFAYENSDQELSCQYFGKAIALNPVQDLKNHALAHYYRTYIHDYSGDQCSKISFEQASEDFKYCLAALESDLLDNDSKSRAVKSLINLHYFHNLNDRDGSFSDHYIGKLKELGLDDQEAQKFLDSLTGLTPGKGSLKKIIAARPEEVDAEMANLIRTENSPSATTEEAEEPRTSEADLVLQEGLLNLNPQQQSLLTLVKKDLEKGDFSRAKRACETLIADSKIDKQSCPPLAYYMLAQAIVSIAKQEVLMAKENALLKGDGTPTSNEDALSKKSNTAVINSLKQAFQLAGDDQLHLKRAAFSEMHYYQMQSSILVDTTFRHGLTALKTGPLPRDMQRATHITLAGLIMHKGVSSTNNRDKEMFQHLEAAYNIGNAPDGAIQNYARLLDKGIGCEADPVKAKQILEHSKPVNALYKTAIAVSSTAAQVAAVFRSPKTPYDIPAELQSLMQKEEATLPNPRPKGAKKDSKKLQAKAELDRDRS